MSIDPPDILKKIISVKVAEVSARKEKISLDALASRISGRVSARPFTASLKRRIDEGQAAVIAEIKRASPSKGILRQHFVPADIARSYATHGASALSVLTDEQFFEGADRHLVEAREASGLPVIRKDFLVDAYQVYEACILRADCILLIVAALDDARLHELYELAGTLSLDVLVEVHDRDELARALALRPSLLGINNRNLRTFETRLETTLELLEHVPSDVTVVTESGIHTRDDVAMMRDNAVHCFLVGEAFMRADEPGEKLAELFD